MGDQQMVSTERATGILEAWERRDLADLAGELDRARRAYAANRAVSFEEQERLELLDGIAGQMRREIRHLAHPGDPGAGVETCFRLLEHLAASGRRPAIQSEKLFFCLY